MATSTIPMIPSEIGNVAVTVQAGAGPSSQQAIKRYGKMRILSFEYGNGTALGTSAANVTIGTVSDIDKPLVQTQNVVYGRNSGAWASATPYPLVLNINTSGQIQLRGNSTNIGATQYIVGELVWFVA